MMNQWSRERGPLCAGMAGRPGPTGTQRGQTTGRGRPDKREGGQRQCQEVLQAEGAGVRSKPFTGSRLRPGRGHVLGREAGAWEGTGLWLPERLWPFKSVLPASGLGAAGVWK